MPSNEPEEKLIDENPFHIEESHIVILQTMISEKGIH